MDVSSLDLHSSKSSLNDWGVESLQSAMSRHLFEYFRTALQPHLLRSHVHPGYLSSGWFLSGALRHPSLMNALLACAAFHLSSLHPKYRLTGIEYYSRAVSSTRKQLEKKMLNGTEDWLMMLLVLSYLVEIWFFDGCHSIQRHLRVAAGLLQSRQAFFRQHGTIPDPSFERLIAGSILFNTSSLSMLMPESSDISFSAVSKHLELFTEPMDMTAPIPKVSRSPLLGVSPELYFFVVQVSRISIGIDESGPELISRFATRFSRWKEAFMPESHTESLYSDERFVLGIQFYICAIDLLLHRFISDCNMEQLPDIKTSNEIVVEGIAIVETLDSYIEASLSMDYYTWPLLIIGSAAKGVPGWVDVIHRKMADVRRISGCGVVKMVTALLARVYEVETEDDGLAILLHIGRGERSVL